MRLTYLCLTIITLLFTLTPSIIYTNNQENLKDKETYLFMALSSEILLTKGYQGIALQNYYKLLQLIPDVKIAERAIEIALASGNSTMAKQIQSLWKRYDKGSSAHLQNLTWQQALQEKNYPYVFNNIREVLVNSTPPQKIQIFNALISLAIQDFSFSNYVQQVHDVAQLYPDNIDAIMADLVYSATAKNQQYTQKAISRLHTSTPQLNERIITLFHFLDSIDPRYLHDFLTKLEPKDYQKEWIPAYTEHFLNDNKQEQALRIIQNALQVYPSASLYTQAGFINALQNQPESVYNRYFLKAYQIANDTQKNYTATFAANGALANKNFKLSKYWLNQIKNPEYLYDKLSMQSIIAYHQKNYNLFKNLLAQIEKLPNRSGMIYQYNQYIMLKLILVSFTETKNSRNTLTEISKLLKEAEQNISNPSDLVNIKVKILSYRGLIYTSLNDYVQAEKNYREAAILYPDALNLNALGYTLLKLNNKKKTEEALSVLQQAYLLNPDSSEIMDSLGWAYVLNEDLKKGIDYLQKAYQITSSSEIASHLAHALWINGNRNEALKIIRLELKKNPLDPYIDSIIKLNQISEKDLSL